MITVKRLASLVFAAILFSTLSAHSYPFWIMDGSFSQVASYEWLAVSAADDSAAWAVMNDGRWAIERTGSTFGGNWYPRTLPDYDLGKQSYNLNDVFVLPTNPNYVWIVGEKARGDRRGVVLLTQNGGTNWSWVYPLENDDDFLTPFYAVSFADQWVGYIAAGNKIVLKTVDGGFEWVKTGPVPCSRSDCFVDIWTSPGAPDTVWVTSDNNFTIAKSTNGGANWSLCQSNAFDRTYYIPDLAQSYDGKFADFDLAFMSYNEGAIALSHGRVALTTDAGDNWAVDSLEPSSSWFEGCDYGSGDTLLLVAGDGLIRARPGTMEYHHPEFDLHDVDMAGARGFAVGDPTTNINRGRKYLRYDPAGFIFDSIEESCFVEQFVQKVMVKLRWHTTFETNTEEWGFHESQSPFIETGKGSYMCDAQGNSSSTTYYEWERPVGPQLNRSVFYTIVLADSDDGYQYYGPYKAHIHCFDWDSACIPDTCRDLLVQDNPDDQGGITKLTWSPPQDTSCLAEYRVGRSIELNGPFFRRSGSQFGKNTTFYDSTALTRKEYYYKVSSVGTFASSQTQPLDSGASVDNKAPVSVDDLWIAWQRRYSNNDSILICIQWTEDSQDSTLAGYWVCPQEPQQTLRGITGAAPIQRNWYVFPADWAVGDKIIVGILPMDYSDNMEDVWKDLDIYVAAQQTSLWNATGHNNTDRTTQTAEGDLHIGFATQDNDTDFAYYQSSTDDGKHWTSPAEIGRGRDPSLAVGAGGTPYMVWRMTEPSGDELLGKLYFSKKQVQGWSTPCEIYSTTAKNFAVGSAAAVTGDDGFANIVWKARENLTGNSCADIVFVGYLNTGYVCPEFIYEPVDTVWKGVPGEDSMQASPTIDLDLKGYPHIAWEKSGDIYYASKGATGWPDSFENISSTPPKDSRNPHMDIQGDWVRVVWEEQHSPSTSYYDVLVWSYWNGATLASGQKSTLSSNCFEPVIAGNFIAWSEKVGDHYEIFVSPYDCETYEWGDSTNISSYPHADSRYPQVLTPVIPCYQNPVIYAYWTEGPGPYWTRFQKKEFTEEQPYYPHDLGLEKPSPVTIKRDGYITYGAPSYATVDYDTDTLRYQCNLDSEYTYSLELTYYHEDSSSRTYELLIDGTPVDTSSVPSEQKVTVEEDLSTADVQDGKITVDVRAFSGDTVTCGDFLLFQCEEGGGEGGGQSMSRRRIALPNRAVLRAPRPNPSLGSPVFEYFLPAEGYATVRVFDVTGRLVKTVLSARKEPGWHSVRWDSDKYGSGTYFCRLNTGRSTITRKFILLR